MMKIVAILSFAAAVSAGVIAPQSLNLNGHAYSHGQVHHAAVATPALAYAHAPVAHAVAAPAYHHAPIAVAHHAPLAVAAPIARVAHAVAPAVRAEPYDPHPQYNYGYSVADALTGDHHSAHEQRDGDVVQGQYSLVEPDGAIRTVTYTADPVQGFNAVVDRSAPAVAKVAVAAPVAVRAALPVAHHAAPYARVAAPVAVAHHAPLGFAHGGAVYHH